jgi:cytochrome c-type biogenesis protein CcmH/NrfG
MALAWYHLAEVSLQLKQVDKALIQYQRTLEIDPSISRAYLGAAKVLLGQDKKAEAIRLEKSEKLEK